jgi:hypothetical protein
MHVQLSGSQNSIGFLLAQEYELISYQVLLEIIPSVSSTQTVTRFFLANTTV